MTLIIWTSPRERPAVRISATDASAMRDVYGRIYCQVVFRIFRLEMRLRPVSATASSMGVTEVLRFCSELIGSDIVVRHSP